MSHVSKIERALAKPTMPAEIARSTGLPMNTVNQELALLEISGVIRQLLDGSYVAIE
jgi:hypothetical protein